jgi:hypothetical protein
MTEPKVQSPDVGWEPSFQAAFQLFAAMKHGAILVHADGTRCDFKPLKPLKNG